MGTRVRSTCPAHIKEIDMPQPNQEKLDAFLGKMVGDLGASRRAREWCWGTGWVCSQPCARAAR